MNQRPASEVAAYLLLAMVALIISFLRDPLRNLTATASSGRATLWVYTPHVAPGDTLEMEVQVRGGRRLGIEAVRAQAGQSYLERHGRGADWGTFIVGRRSGGSDSAEISVTVPADAVAGETLPVSVEVDFVEAVSTGSGKFENQKNSEVIVLDVVVRTPAGRDQRRALSALGAFAVLALAIATALLVRHWMRSSSAAAKLGCALALLAVGAYLGYGWFALPLVAATRILADVFAVLAVIAFLAIPVFVVYLVGRRAARLEHSARFLAVEVPTPAPAGDDLDRAMSARDYPERMARDVPLATLVAALKANGVPVRGGRRGFTWDDRQPRRRLVATVSDPDYVKPKSVTILTTDRRMVLPIAEVMVKLLGPVEIIFNENQRVLVDSSTTAGELLLVLNPKWSAVEAMADAILKKRPGGKGAALPPARVK